MALRTVALVPDTNIMIMLRGLAIRTINVQQFVNGVIGVSGVLVIPIASRESDFNDEQIMKILKELVEFAFIYRKKGFQFSWLQIKSIIAVNPILIAFFIISNKRHLMECKFNP